MAGDEARELFGLSAEGTRQREAGVKAVCFDIRVGRFDIRGGERQGAGHHAQAVRIAVLFGHGKARQGIKVGAGVCCAGMQAEGGLESLCLGQIF